MTIGIWHNGGALSFLGGENDASWVDAGRIPLGSHSWNYEPGHWWLIVSGSQGKPWAYFLRFTGQLGGFMSRCYPHQDDPGGEFPLIGDNRDDSIAVIMGSGASNKRKLRLVRLGSGGSRWSGRTNLTSWSSALPVGTFKDVDLLIDDKTRGSSHRWVVLLIDGTEEWSYDTGAAVLQDWHPTPEVNGMASVSPFRIYWDDLVGLYSETAGDAPHLTNWPKPRVTRQDAIDDVVGQDDWTGTPDNTDQYKNWDDPTTPDGDGSYNYTAATSKKQANDGETAATVGLTGHTVLHKHDDGNIGPVMNIVHRDGAAGGGKFNAAYINSLGTSPDFPAKPATGYGGQIARFSKAGGWAVSDLASLDFGLETLSSGHDLEWRVTHCTMHWCTYSATLPKTTTPTLGAVARPQVLVL